MRALWFRFTASLLLLSVAAAFAAAQEISDGRLGVRLHSGGSRYALYAVEPGQPWRSLLFEPDPRTSVLSVLEENRVHRMGDSGGFSRTIVEDEGTVTVKWRSSTLEVEQIFTVDNGVTGAASVVISVTNRSETRRRVGVRYLLDTWLGERSGVHFVTADGREIRSEERFVPDDRNRYWVSSDGTLSMYYAVAGDAVSDAEAVVFGNWKRLYDARWEYAVRSERSFDLIPYSINDSAAAVYYPIRRLEPGESYRIQFLLGIGRHAPDAAAIAGAPGAVAPSAVPAPAPSAVPARRPVADRRTLEAEIDRVNALLREVNRRVASDRPVEPAEVEALQLRLRLLEDALSPR